MSARLRRLAVAFGVLTGLACISEGSAARCDFAVVSYDLQEEARADCARLACEGGTGKNTLVAFPES